MTSFSNGLSMDRWMVEVLKAPELPEGYHYKVSIAHDPGAAAEVTVTIVRLMPHGTVRVAKHTERTRVSLDMAVGAAARGAAEILAEITESL